MIIRRIIISTFSLLVTIVASATTYDFGQMELGKQYQLPESMWNTYNNVVKGTITAPSDGTLIQKGLNGTAMGATLYTSSNHSKQLQSAWVSGFSGDDSQYSYQVKEGVTYYIYGDFVSPYDGNSKLMFTMADDIVLSLESIEPAPGSTVASNVNLTGDILLNFNMPVTHATACLKVADIEHPVAPSGFSGVPTTLALNISEAMTSLYRSGHLDADGGTPFRLIVTGVADNRGNLLNGDGNLTIDYVADKKAPELVSTVIPPIMKSFCPAGTPDARCEFVFDQPIRQSAVLSISLGSVEADVYYEEQLPLNYDGAKITCDWSGKLRELNRYTTMQGSNIIAMKLYNVIGETGVYAAGDGGGSVGSYSYTIEYEYIEPVDIVSEFMPESGSDLANVDEIEMWFNHADMVTFDGVKFSCDDGTSVTIAQADLNITVENNECTVLIAVPEVVKNKKNVCLAPEKISSLDGYDKTKALQAFYNGFFVKLISPITEGQHIASTGTDDFVFTINDDYPYVRYDFYNQPDAASAGGAPITKQPNGTWCAENKDFVCYEYFTPSLVVTAYSAEADYLSGGTAAAAETFAFEFRGTTEAFTYSTFNFESISPAENEMVKVSNDMVFTLKFDGLVTVDALMADAEGLFNIPFSNIEAITTPGEDNYGYANEWKLYPGADNLKGKTTITFAVVAHDMLGMLLEGSFGTGADDYLCFTYTIDPNSDDSVLSVAADSTPNGTVIHNLHGQVVYRCTSKQHTKAATAVDYNLPGGLYIVNGRLTHLR